MQSLEHIRRLVLAGTNSGCGKTTIAIGLMAALSRMNYRVQGFKAGPDYIDPSHHTHVTGIPSRNLDTWMIERDRLLELFEHSAKTADISIIEGVMGMFDGYDALDERGNRRLKVAVTQRLPFVGRCCALTDEACGPSLRRKGMGLTYAGWSRLHPLPRQRQGVRADPTAANTR